MRKRDKIELTQEQRKEFGEFMKGGEHNVHLVQRAQIVLALDTSEGRSVGKQEDIARIVGVSSRSSTAGYGWSPPFRKKFAGQGHEFTLY
jgi:hypothetical protein